VLLGRRGDDPLNTVLTARRYALHDRHVADEPREQQRAREHDDYQNRERDEVLARTACLLVVDLRIPKRHSFHAEEPLSWRAAWIERSWARRIE
jgi:hypothetical protein